MAKAPKIPAGWYSKSEMSAILGVTEQTVDQVYRKASSPDAVKTIARKVYFHARLVIDAWCKKQLESAKPPADPQATLNALIEAGPDSPALEEMRRYKAGQEKIRLALMDRSAIPRDQLEPALAQFAGVLRRAGETLQRQFGADAATVLNEAVDETVASWKRMLSEDHPGEDKPDAVGPAADGGAGAGSQAADDPPVRRR